MLSLANSSDPSCSSSKASGFKANERDSDQLPLQEADPVVKFGEAQARNFSIRNHVFASRSKNIGKNWPFPNQLLQLCLKHGVRDLLPPFEPPNSVRSQYCFVRSASETEKDASGSLQLEATVLLDGELNLTRDDLCLTLENELLKCSDKEEAPCCDNLVNDGCEVGSTLTNHCDIERFSAPTAEPESNKCRLIPNPGAISETIIQAEETSTTSTASDIMASKVCPVCKAFSSTSNTTLNAHMDQCLSMESDAAPTVGALPKLKVKPRKKRLMEDIYATASICTLEDLDRRNGSTWASDLNVVTTMPAEANSEPKKLKLPQSDARDDKKDGSVYVDSNGIKLRILSKFNDVPQILSAEELMPRKNFKSVQDENIILIKKKKYFTTTYSKKMKLKLRNKKLSSLKLFKNEEESKAAHYEESLLEDEAGQSFSYGSATLKNWPSSKRSDLPKKIAKKSFHKIMEHPKPGFHVKMLEKSKSATDIPSATKSDFGKLSRLSEPFADQNKDNHKKRSQKWSSEGTSTNALLVKLSRVSEPLAPTSRTTNEEILMRKSKIFTSSKGGKRSVDTCHFPLKTKRVSTLSGTNSSTIKLRKHRSLLAWNDRKIREFSHRINARKHRPVVAVDLRNGDEDVADQHLHPGSTQCQDTQTRISEMQVDQNVGMNTLENANSLINQAQNLQPDSNNTANLMMPTPENEMPVAKVFIDKQEEETPNHKLEHGRVESEVKRTMSAQESSACLTSHGDLAIDIPRVSSAIALDPSVPIQEIKSDCCIMPPVSPASSASTMSPESPMDHHSKSSVLLTAHGPPTFPLPLITANKETLGIDIERNHQVEMHSAVKKPQQFPNFHPCCCSWQSVMAGSMPATKQKPLPNLLIRPNISSCAYSSLRTDGANTPSMESPTESILTRACSDVGSTSPSCGTPTQSSSNSILRLMGKDLMVVHTEESAQIPKLHSPATDNISNVQALPSPLGFASYTAVSNHGALSFAVHNQPPSTINSQLHNCLPSFHQRIMNHKAYTANEVIVIEDSDRVFSSTNTSASRVPLSHAVFQRPFAYFPSHGHLLPRDSGIRPSNLVNQGNSVSAPHLPRPFVFQSPSTTHLNSPFYYPQSLR